MDEIRFVCTEHCVSPEQRVHFAKSTCRDLTQVKEQLVAAPPAAAICHAPQTSRLDNVDWVVLSSSGGMKGPPSILELAKLCSSQSHSIQ
jgi:hypothetical protein